ncbi:peroxiredoxin family protein [Aquibacillus rhizosphaerae]|uniref:Redoxin domain-containing protein n=1 Tax=Aquibacillus rhizosphaerae TaxID=3051431 RepID=A0ABT7L1F3_9BACI|nr:redoxin domain-containing protein [Aquibacillus sp. LR5S19]MDL4839671.1 redoxin domain-containing protein [Aquibacillus sp. LR5S19]
MKKIIISVVLLAMFGYAVYDLVKSEDNNTTTSNKEELSTEGNQSNSTNEVESTGATVGLEVGNLAPDFKLQTLNGETVKLSDFRGRRVMLNFWATWCPPCRAEMPDMEKFYQEKDVTILAVNLTETEASMQDVHDFVEEFGLTFPILLDKKIEVATTYQIRPIPTSYMIDSNGIIRYQVFGALNYEMMVSEFENMK